MTKKIEIKKGLLPLESDGRDYRLSGVFGVPRLDEIPREDFVVGEASVMDQLDSDMCTAFAGCLTSGFQENLTLAPEYNFAKSKFLLGEKESFGVDLRTALKSFIKFGSLERKDCPFKLEEMGRDFVADWERYPAYLDTLAVKYKKKSFFAIESFDNYFNSIRAALWKFKGKKQAVLVGFSWCSEWTYADNGIINKYGTPEVGHCVAIIGQKYIGGKPYLIIQNSLGTKVGDSGFHYVSEEVVNHEMGPARYGAFMLVDLDPKEAKYLAENNLDISFLWLAKVAKVLNCILK